MPPPTGVSGVYRFDDYEVNLTAGELRRRNLKIRLQDKPFQLLAILLARPGELVSRDELRERLWEADTFVDFDQGLNTAVKKLRHALNDSAESPRYVETYPRKGYRFLASVETVLKERSADALPTASRPLISPPAKPNSWRWLAGVALVLVSIGVFLARYQLREQARVKSLAVLPLVNVGPEVSQEYFSDGITDALITGLARIGTLRVISRTSAMQYKGTHKRLPEIARELKVDAVLEGTLFRNKSRVRIDVKLIRAASDEHLWQETYEADLSDMLVLADEISSNVARRIAVKLSADEQHALVSAAPISVDAYEASLKGRFFWNQRSLPALRKGIEYFQTAIAADVRSAPAYAGLASCYNMLTFYGAQPPGESFPKAKEAALRAIAIDDTSAEAHAALAFALLHYDWNWAGAESEFRRSIELNPNYPDARQWFSHLLLARGRTTEALAEAHKALTLDPLSLSVNTHLGHHYVQTRSYDAAITHLRQTLEMYPSAEQVHFWLGRAYEAKKQFADAERELHRASELSPANLHFRAALAHLHASAGNSAKANVILHELSALSEKQYVSAYSLAVLYAGLGDRSRTFEQLRRARQERAEGVLYLNIEPYFDGLRDAPEFNEITRSIGL